MLMTVSEIVADYIREYRANARDKMRFYEIQRSPAKAIEKAALCVLPSGKRHPHQHRISGAVLELAEARLQEVQGQLKRAKNFDALHRIIAERIGSIPGIGALTVYDIAHRIGAFFRIYPELVYLHAGTRKGASFWGIKGDAFDPGILPKPFLRLLPYEIEDCLCIYKKDFGIEEAQRSVRACAGKNPKKPRCHF
jgi:hypothetical protein